MRLLFFFLLIGASLLSMDLAGLEITAKFPVVTTSANGAPEVQAPKLLQEHLSKIFKAPVQIIPESKWKKGTPAIVLRPDAKLDNEEWNIQSDGKVLTISGGWPRGLYYGVCEFLEKFGGVRWFTVHETRIPFKKAIIVPDNRSFRRKPAFPFMRRTGTMNAGKQFRALDVRLKQNAIMLYQRNSSLFSVKGIGECHTYYKLTKYVPKGREKMLPMDHNGRRVRPADHVGSNQVCFSSPEFRAYTKEQVGKWIAAGEKYVKKRKLARDSWMRWIDLSQNDNHNYCRCPGCKKLITKYGTISGAQLEFINDIASAFPDYIFQTFAYHFTQEPPKNIKARDNVMIHTAFLSYGDLLRPISHPNNARIRKQYDGWRNIAKRKAVWAYHRLYHMTEAFPWPQCCYWNIAENIRYYHKYGAVKLYTESEFRERRNPFPSRAFNDLHYYLECKLQDDPYQDEKAIIEEFFQHQYGPAVKEMKAYSAYLKKRLDGIKGIISSKPLQARNVLDAEFFKTANKILDAAEAKAGRDRALLARIAMERIPVDYAAAQIWKKRGEACGLTREQLLTRLEKNMKLFFDRYHLNKQIGHFGKRIWQWEKECFEELKLMRTPIPVPEKFAKEDVIQIPAFGNSSRPLADDPEATLGKAVKLGKVESKWDHTKFPMVFLLYDRTDRSYPLSCRIPKDQVHQDEKYHLYYIGRHAPDGYRKETLWGHQSWKLHLTDMYKKLWDPIDGGREYDLYVSCKMTGPAYVKGSKKENAVYVDKLLAVKKGRRVPGRAPEDLKNFPIPRELSHEAAANVVQIPAFGCAPLEVTGKDKDAVLGVAVKLGKVAPKYDHAKFPMSFALYDETAKKYYLGKKISKVPQDEKYHIYCLGFHTPDLTHKELLFGHRSWKLQIGHLYKVFLKYAEPGRPYKFYVSCKLTGPAYVKGSKKENAVYVDRLIAVKYETVPQKIK